MKYLFIVLLFIGVIVTVAASFDKPWNGLDLIGWLTLIFSAMRVMRPIPSRTPNA